MVTSVGGNSIGEQTIVEWGPSSDAYALDVGSAEIANFASTPSVQPASHQVAWSVGTGRSADIALVTVHVSREGGALTNWTWRPLPATQTGGAQLPTLPTADVADYNIAGTDNAQIDDLKIATVAGGYDAARAFAFDTDFTAAPAGSSSGRAAIVDYDGESVRERLRRAASRRDEPGDVARSAAPTPRRRARRRATARPARAP